LDREKGGGVKSCRDREYLRGEEREREERGEKEREREERERENGSKCEPAWFEPATGR
jgi:hypothetical protein